MTVSIILLGAGQIGRRHAALLAANPEVHFAGIVDPDPATVDFAAQFGVPRYASIEDVTAARIDGALIATPNTNHAPDTIAAAARGWAVLVEKPVADSVEAASSMAKFCDQQGVPLLVGHHRRHHPFVTEARKLIRDGAIGQLTLVSILWGVRKHDTYYDADWRKRSGAGPVLINLIHEVDLLRHMCGEVVDVRALTSNAVRGHEVEDTAAIVLRLENGALVTIAISDAALSPWSFEAASGENPDIAVSGAHSWRIAGTKGALEFPNLRMWSDAQDGNGDWSRRLESREVETPPRTPLEAQLDHFIDVIKGNAEPLVSGTDALKSLEVTQRVLLEAQQAAPT